VAPSSGPTKTAAEWSTRASSPSKGVKEILNPKEEIHKHKHKHKHHLQAAFNNSSVMVNLHPCITH
jgi:hypothetical protein